MKTLVITTTDPGFMGTRGSDPHVAKQLFEPLEGDMLSLEGAYKDRDRALVKIYIHGEAEELAGYDIPVFVRGNIEQFNRPYHEQDIILDTKYDGSHKVNAVCMSRGRDDGFNRGTWFLVTENELDETVRQIDHNCMMW